MKIQKVDNLVPNLHNKIEYRMIKFNHAKNAKNYFEKDFLKLMNAVFGKTMENMRKHRNIKLVITERRKNYLVSEPSYHTKKFFTENLLAIEMKKKLKYLSINLSF